MQELIACMCSGREGLSLNLGHVGSFARPQDYSADARKVAVQVLCNLPSVNEELHVEVYYSLQSIFGPLLFTTRTSTVLQCARVSPPLLRLPHPSLPGIAEHAPEPLIPSWICGQPYRCTVILYDSHRLTMPN